MSRLTRFLLAAAVLGAAAIAASTQAQWGRSTKIGVLFVLLAALVGAGILAFRSRRHERHSAAKNLSPALATLSSAAILAVYAAGYHRTNAVAGGFGEESNRRKPPAVSETAAAAQPSQPSIEPAGDGSHAPALATQSAKPQQRNRASKSAHAGATTTPSLSAAAPREYAAAAPVSPQAPQSSSAPNAATAEAAPQIAMNPPDPSVQLAAPAAPAAPQPKALYKDGTYSGWGSCRHGDIQAAVTIQDGKIASVAITQCLTRYSCSWIAALPGQVVKRQSPEVDYVSGASQSTDAFYGAVVSALSQARN